MLAILFQPQCVKNGNLTGTSKSILGGGAYFGFYGDDNLC